MAQTAVTQINQLLSPDSGVTILQGVRLRCKVSQWLITAKGDRKKKCFPRGMERNLMEDIKSAIYMSISILLDTSLEFLQS